MDCIMCGEILGSGLLCEGCTEYTLEYLRPNEYTLEYLHPNEVMPVKGSENNEVD